MIRVHPKLLLLIRLAISALLLWLAFRPIDWHALVQASQQLNPAWLLVAWLTVLASNTLAACRWGWIMRKSDLKLAWLRYISLYFAGGLINQGIPSTLGGDTYRAVQGTRGMRISDGPALRYGLLTVALDRGMGLAGNIILGAIGLISAGVIISPWSTVVGWLVLLAVIGSMLVAGLLLPLPRVSRLVLRLLTAMHLPHGLPSLNCVFLWPSNIGQILVAVLVHLLNLATFWACLMAYGSQVELEALMIGLPALGLLLMLPISISGWGLRETTLSAVLLMWSIPASTTVLASISYGLIVALAYLPAILTLIHGKQAEKSNSQTTIRTP